MNRAITETRLEYSYELLPAFFESERKNNEVNLKLISKVPKTDYYSCLNEIGAHFDEVIYPTLNIENEKQGA